MPLYVFTCDGCAATQEIFASMRDRPAAPECVPCRTPMSRAWHRERAGNHLDREFARPIEMFSIAMEDQEEIRQFARQTPGVEIADDPNHPLYGVPIARTRTQKLAALNTAGFAERGK